MILNIFKNSQPVALVLIPIFMAIAWFSSSHTDSIQLVSNPMPIYNILYSFFGGLPSWAGALFGFLLTTSQVYHLNFIIQKHEVLYKNSYLPALFYMAITIATITIGLLNSREVVNKPPLEILRNEG